MTTADAGVVLENDQARMLWRLLQQTTPHGDGTVVIRGEAKSLPIYDVPTTLLKYNNFNFRIRHQVDSRSQSEDGVFGMTDDDVQDWIETKLIEDDPSTNESLQNSIQRDGLKNAVIVRLSDAVVVDGNRRLMTHRVLARSGFERFKSISVIVIQEPLTDTEWLELEARYQFEAETKSYYDNINEAKILKELHAEYQDYSVVADKVNSTKRHVESQIATLDLIDTYLEQVEQPSNYEIIPSWALFEELAREIGRRSRDWSPEELEQFESTAYNIITLRLVNDRKPKSPGDEDDFSLDDRTFRKVLKAYSLENARQALTDTVGEEGTLAIENIDQIRDEFAKDVEQALVIHDAQKQAKEPLRMINLAINHLKTVQTIGNDPRIIEAIKGVTTELGRIRKLLQGDAQ